MDNFSPRLKITAGGLFTPSAPGATKQQFLGFEELQPAIGQTSAVHQMRLTVDNFGAGGTDITLDADTLAVTFGGTSSGSATKGDGLDYNGDTIEVGGIRMVAMRVVDAPSDSVKIKLAGATDEFILLASNGSVGFIALGGSAEIAGAGTWQLRGPTGAQASSWVIDILAVYEPA